MYQCCEHVSMAAQKMGYSRKNPHPPDGWGPFLTPPSHLDFLKHKTPPPNWISKVEDPPPTWISGKK